MTGTGAQVDDIGPILLSAGLVEGNILRRYQAIESTDGVLPVIVVASLTSQQSGFDYARKVLELDYLGFHKLHIGCEIKMVKRAKEEWI